MNFVVKKKPKAVSQANANSSNYNSHLAITYGAVQSNNDNGTCNVLLVNGYLLKQVRILSTIAPTKEPITGGIKYPQKDSEVIILYPANDINSGFILPAAFDYRDENVKSEILSGGDKEILPGGWEIEYDQETGNATFENGDFSMTVNNTTKIAEISDWNGHGVKLSPMGCQLVTGDSSTWQPNILGVDPFSGVPHGGAGAGIVKLKGG